MKKAISTSTAPKAVGPYSQGISVELPLLGSLNAAAGAGHATSVKTGKLLFLSGQLGIDPAVGKLVDGGVEAQTRQIFKNIENLLQEAGGDLSHIVKMTVFLKEMTDFAKMNGVYAQAVPEPYPARSAFAVKELPLGADVEIETIAMI